jgi:hypothetical protein
VSSTSAPDPVEGQELVETQDPAPGIDVHVREHHQNVTRRWLAAGLLGLVAAIALLAQLALIFKVEDLTWEIEREYLGMVFAPILASATTALGFFFAGNREQR